MALRLGLPGRRARSETREKNGIGEEVLSSEFETDQKAEMRESSRSEVRGSRNFEPRTSNFQSRPSCASRASYVARVGPFAKVS